MQSGGWTVDWQGDHNTNADFPGATSILDGIKAAVAAAGGEVVTRLDDSKRPAAAIVVYGETPYAEYPGDRETLEFSQPGASHLEMLARLRGTTIPVISLFISGRPLWVNREINLSDAFVAVWLPGSEGGGIADLLFKSLPGKAQYDFTGTLSFSWPATAMPVRFAADNTVQGALFPMGFGLTLAKSQELELLSEDPAIPAAAREKDTLFYAGHVTAPWSIYVADPIGDIRLTLQSQTTPTRAVTAQLDSQAVEVQWSGQGKGEMRIGGRAVNLSTAAGQALRLHYRVDEAPRQPVILSMRCAGYSERCGVGEGQGADLTASLQSARMGSWMTMTIPLACLSREQVTPLLVAAPFAVETSGSLAVRFDDIRLVHDPAASACPR